jgi:hypothetical protein
MAQVFMYRWADGDVSFVQAENRQQAAEYLDERGEVELAQIRPCPHFAVHLKLRDDGHQEVDCWGELCEEQIWMAHPDLLGIVKSAEPDETELAEIRAAVSKERESRIDTPKPGARLDFKRIAAAE